MQHNIKRAKEWLAKQGNFAPVTTFRRIPIEKFTKQELIKIINVVTRYQCEVECRAPYSSRNRTN